MLVDPAVAIVAVIDIAAGDGSAVAEFAIPSMSPRVATPVYAQALLLDGSGVVPEVTSRARTLLR